MKDICKRFMLPKEAHAALCDFIKDYKDIIRTINRNDFYVVLKNGDRVWFVPDINYRKWCLGRTYYVDGVKFHSGLPIIDSLESNEIKKCPFCGGEAKYSTRRVSDGYCSYLAGEIRCTNEKCGCRTPEITIDGYYGETTTEEDVYRIWNNRM